MHVFNVLDSKKEDIRPLEAFEIWMWRCVMKVHVPWTKHKTNEEILQIVKGVLQRTFFISTNERLMYKFYKNCNYFIFK